VLFLGFLIGGRVIRKAAETDAAQEETKETLFREK
jgi:hypothetical protein